MGTGSIYTYACLSGEAGVDVQGAQRKGRPAIVPLNVSRLRCDHFSLSLSLDLAHTRCLRMW